MAGITYSESKHPYNDALKAFDVRKDGRPVGVVYQSEESDPRMTGRVRVSDKVIIRWRWDRVLGPRTGSSSAISYGSRKAAADALCA